MRLTQLSIERPILIAMVFAVISLLGALALTKIPAELNPRISFPTITVITIYPGAAPEEVEAVVTRPIEDAVYAVNGVQGVNSRSQENLSLVIVDFKVGANLDVAAASVREKVELARAQLPAAVRAPMVGKIDVNAQPVMVLGVTAEGRTPRQLRAIVDNTIKPRLARGEGVAAAEVVGGEVREIQVTLRRALLEQHGLAMGDIVTALQAASVTAPSGHVSQAGRDFAVRMVGEFASLDDIRKTQIPKLSDGSVGADLSALGSASSLSAMRSSGGAGALPSLGNLNSLLGGGSRAPKRPLTIGEVAEVKDTVAERETIARVQQRESVGLIITKLSDANTVTAAEGVKAALAELRASLPDDVRVYVAQDQSARVLDALHDVTLALALGVLLTVVVVYIFLNDWRGTIIVAGAIPASILATFVPMYLLGFTLNQMTMLGLALSVGILVDDSIVVLENIHRHLHAGRPPREAALLGRQEIGLAALAITLVDVVVFLPIAFMGGMVGQFFQQFALTAAFATLFSLFVSFTLTPAMASRWYASRSSGEGATQSRAFDRGYPQGRGDFLLADSYRGLLRSALRRRGQVTVMGFSALAVALLAAAQQLNVGLLPAVDSGALRVRIEMPPDASLEATERAVLAAETAAMKVGAVKTVHAHIGQVPGHFASDNEQGRHLGSLLVELQPRGPRTRTDVAVAADLRKQLRGIPAAAVTVAPVRGFEGALSPIELQLFGDDLTHLREVGEQIRARIAKLPGVINPTMSLRLGKAELQVRLNREKAASFDVMPGLVAMALRDAIEGNAETKFSQGGERQPIRVQYAKEDRDSADDVRRIIVGRTSKRPVFVDDIADVHYGAGAADIARKNRRRMATVTADLAPGIAVGAMQERIERELKEVSIGGVERRWGGEAEQIAENMLPWLYAMALAAVLIYMLLASLYNSLLQPLIVLSGLPMALVGAIAALLWCRELLTMPALIGLIMLMGIVGKNGILLVDYTNTLRARGMERAQALLEAGATRLRPILMTTLTIVFGMLPIALRLGRGAEMRAPMAITVIGGLLLSTLLTLVLVPALYTYVDDLSTWLFGTRQRAESVSP